MRSTARAVKGPGFKLLAIVLAVALSVSVTAWAKNATGPDPTAVTACGTLSRTSVIYQVMNNISTLSTGNCIVLSGHNSALDLHGFTITGPEVRRQALASWFRATITWWEDSTAP